MYFNTATLRIIKNLAIDMHVETAALLAVIQVESLGKTRQRGLVPIRWEGHYFWKFLPEHKRLEARRKGLADPRSQKIKNPRDMQARYDLLDRAKAIDPEAALKSISMGVGQVMGAHAERLGFTDVFDMWDQNQSDEGQFETIARYIRGFNLVDELQEHNWKGFARAYNGPAYYINRYDKKLAEAYQQHSGQDNAEPTKFESSIIKIGDRRKTRVKYIQNRLNEIGYTVIADGDFGPETKRQIQNFQLDNGLKPDGVVGDKTQKMLDKVQVREVTPERANMTKAELKKRSRIAKNGTFVQNTGAVVTAGAAGTKAAEETGMLEKLSGAGEKVEQAVSAFRPLQLVYEFASDNIWAFVAIGGIAVGFWGHKIVAARLEDHRTGKTS